MKQAIKFGFGAALGIWLFKACKTVADDFLYTRFASDPEFREQIKKVSPTLYYRYRIAFEEKSTFA